jgi:acetyltransferase
LPQEIAQQALQAYGIPSLSLVMASSPGEAVQAARSLGLPVALKVASPDIPHKSDSGGVLLNLGDLAAIEQGFLSIEADARRAHPSAEIQGVYVQRMLPPGQEVILGAVQDPQFGALVMFGSGGVEVEGLGDVAFALAPLERLEAERMLERTWAGRKLRGYRSLPPVDREAVLEALLRLSCLAADFPALVEIEINPLRALPKQAFAIDVRIRYAGTPRALHPPVEPIRAPGDG